jgi:hypothetical protein
MPNFSLTKRSEILGQGHPKDADMVGRYAKV